MAARLFRILCLTFCLLPAAACREKPQEQAPFQGRDADRQVADLTIALLPERNVFEQKKKYHPLQQYLSDRLGISVYFKLLDNYELIFSEIQQKHVDGGFWGSMNGAIAQVRGGVEILARPVWLDGSSSYWSYVYTSKKSGITADPGTWSGRSIAFVNMATTAGFLYPMSILRQAGIEEEPSDYFDRAIFSGSHDASIMAVFQDEVEMGASKNTVFEEYLKRHPEIRDRLVILLESPKVPSNGLGVRPDLSEELKAKLKKTLIEMNQDEEGRAVLEKFGALRFIETSFQDYQPVFDMADKAGIDLTEWPLRDVRGARPYR